MNTNINIDNYEAYLLDYMEGNISPEGTAELKAFVAAQGLDWDELTEELPHLETPTLAYENKEGLKKRATVVPLYAKIASAAAAAGLLLTVSLWPEKQLPKLEPIADLKPIEATRIERPLERLILQTKPAQFVKPNVVVKEKKAEVEKHVVVEKAEMPMLAQLEPIKTEKVQIAALAADIEEPDFDYLAYRINTGMAIAQYDSNSFEENVEDEDVSFIGRGLLWLTGGRHSSLASLINSGLRQAKKETIEAATDMALAAYQRADEQLASAKERWEEKRGE
ncbi:MAG: hypothetical protein IJP44_05020 [Bacteroidales bacterium]|nr:hypothetical protein [Bacteroidales bacterium]